MFVNLNVPYYSQRDNQIDALGTCGATSSAMCLSYFGVADPGPMTQYEDDVKREFDRLGFDHHAPAGIKRLLEHMHLRDELLLDARLSDITAALDQSKVCILHGYFTVHGHIIVIRGYDSNGNFIVNDPNGEWQFGGYLKNSSAHPDNKGENKTYTRRLISTAGNTYTYGDALSAYQNWSDHKVENTATMWLHAVSKPS